MRCGYLVDQRMNLGTFSSSKWATNPQVRFDVRYWLEADIFDPLPVIRSSGQRKP